MQERCNSIASALELSLSYTNLSIYSLVINGARNPGDYYWDHYPRAQP